MPDPEQPRSGAPLFNKLPVEIHAEILSLATHSHEKETRRFRFPSLLRQVARRWKVVTDSTPGVWSFILVKNPWTLAHVPSRVAKTGRLALDIGIIVEELDPPDPAAVMRALRSSSFRWENLRITAPSGVESFAVHLPKNLPRLRSILLEDYDPMEFTVEVALPQLRFMHLEGSSLIWHPSTNFSSLIEFRVDGGLGEEVDMTMERLFTFLLSARNLQVLVLNEPWVFERPTDAELVAWRGHPIKLPQLKKMVLDELDCWEVVVLLTCIQVPGLQTLLLGIRQPRRDAPTSSFWVDQLQTPYPCLRQLILTPQMEVDDADAEHIFSLMPEIHEVLMTRRIPRVMFSRILQDGSSKSKLSTLSFKDIAPLELQNYYLSLTPSSQAFLQQMTLNFHSNASYRGTWGRKQFDVALSNLREAIPRLRCFEYSDIRTLGITYNPCLYY